MSIISENIRVLRKGKGWTQQELADNASIKRSLVGAYEEGRAEPSADKLLTFASLFEVSVDSLISADLSKEEPESKPFKVLSITVDSDDNENIELVNQRAAAGYTNGFADAEYVASLPRFRLPFLPSNATYRAFEIAGDSMLPLTSGTIVIGKYVEHLRDIKDGNTYVLVTSKEGVVFKRVFKYLEDKEALFLVSDNKMYSPYEVPASEVDEVWEASAYISVDFPEADQKQDMNLEQLVSMVSTLKDEIHQLKENK